jgi:hypothetical protein
MEVSGDAISYVSSDDSEIRNLAAQVDARKRELDEFEEETRRLEEEIRDELLEEPCELEMSDVAEVKAVEAEVERVGAELKRMEEEERARRIAEEEEAERRRREQEEEEATEEAERERKAEEKRREEEEERARREAQVLAEEEARRAAAARRLKEEEEARAAAEARRVEEEEERLKRRERNKCTRRSCMLACLCFRGALPDRTCFCMSDAWPCYASGARLNGHCESSGCMDVCTSEPLSGEGCWGRCSYYCVKCSLGSGSNCYTRALYYLCFPCWWVGLAVLWCADLFFLVLCALLFLPLMLCIPLGTTLSPLVIALVCVVCCPCICLKCILCCPFRTCKRAYPHGGAALDDEDPLSGSIG